MRKKDSEKFLFLVNSIGISELLGEYADYRINLLTQEFQSISSLEELRGLQRAIVELKRLKTLKDEVNNPSGD